MFNKNKFAHLLIKAKGERSINEYGEQSGVSSAHISRLSRGLLGSPPNPQTIRKLADYAHNEVTYDDLMAAAGHLSDSPEQKIQNAVSDNPELLSFWQDLSQREDLKTLFRQTKDLPPDAIKKVLRYIKMVEDEEANEDF